MTAKKEGLETIHVLNQNVAAQKIKVQLSGFLSIFWHSDLWYDVDNNDLLLYQAAEGPKAPVTVMRLIEKKTGSDQSKKISSYYRSCPYFYALIK